MTAIFNPRIWRPALEKYGAVTHLSVAVYDVERHIVCGPAPDSPLNALFMEFSYDPGLFAECARRCLAQEEDRPTVIVTHPLGLAVVGTALHLGGDVVGAAVAGYAVMELPHASTIERLAKEARVPLARLRDIVRQQAPVPERRFGLHGELLQVLGDTILQESARTRQYEEAAAELALVAAAKDDFLAVLSHELRTPLTPIIAWTRILKMTQESAKVAQAAEVIERNALLQVRLVDDLLELNRASRGTMALDLKPLRLKAIVSAAIEAVSETVDSKGLTLECHDAGEPLFVEADADRMQQVFRNVLTNAVKFTAPGGQIAITLVREGDETAVAIRDTGQGIAREFLPFVFDMFRQEEIGTRRKYAGLGIGMALVKRLTEAHGGSVSVTSGGVGHGTEVVVRLPLASAPGDDASLPGRDAGNALDQLRVLLIEDAPDTRDAARMMLQRLGATVTVAGNGREALDALSAASVDVVLCDLRMPRMDGYEFLRELYNDPERPPPPVIAVSGFAGSGDHQKTQAAGFEGHINKPFNETMLQSEINAVLSRRHIGEVDAAPHEAR